LSDRSFEPVLAFESPGDSDAKGLSDGSLGVADGVAELDAEGDFVGEVEGDFVGDAVGLEPDVPDPPDPPDPVEPPVPPPEPPVLPPPPDDGVAVGEGVGDAVGDGVEVVPEVTGGATPGGTVPPAGRSCCQENPTDPPDGTVSPPAPYDEYVHEAWDPSAHQSPQ
jgi:hypothetical protein